MLDIENFDYKFKNIIQSVEWKELQNVFNKSKNVFLFGHGGNMGVADHAAIDMTRLTDKNVMAPGSGIVSTSIISDESFETWLAKWLEFRSRGKDLSDCLAIGISCSTSGDSSNALVYGLNWAKQNGMKTCLFSAQPKDDLEEGIISINQNCVNYHTSEIMSLALTYELIHGAGFKCPTIAGKAQQRRFETLGIESEVTETSNLNVPPGFENQLNNIGVDFDGVIHTFDKGWHDGTCYGDPLPGALDAIRTLSEDWNIIIFSAKVRPDRPLVDGKTGYELVDEWLQDHGVRDLVAEITHEKPRAQHYIDDKAIEFTNNWTEVLERLK